ncbi:MAG: 5-(carboxyamino)imidazole ribonucleotide synthase [Woeseiaceae bacterium]
MQRVAVIGGGQLGRMLGSAGRQLGVELLFLDPSADAPAASEGRIIARAFDDPQGLAELAANADVITYEFENVPLAALRSIPRRLPVLPPPDALRMAQDRWLEKRLFEALDIPVARYRRVDAREELRAAASALGYPFVVKTRSLGYDGKGQILVDAPDGVDAAWDALGGRSLIAEQWVRFEREVSIIGVRRAGGELRVYPLTENRHEGGILRLSRAPMQAPLLEAAACGYIGRLLTRLDYVGVLALELFVSGDRLVANEFAPRVHNSGHWTIEGAATSQFRNHLLAILDRPLGATNALAHAAMINLIGTLPDAQSLPAGVPHFLHDYGKAPRPGRKLGHITVLAPDEETLSARLRALQACVPA